MHHFSQYMHIVKPKVPSRTDRYEIVQKVIQASDLTYITFACTIKSESFPLLSNLKYRLE